MNKYVAVCGYKIPCLHLLPEMKFNLTVIVEEIKFQEGRQFSYEKEIWVQLQKALVMYCEEDCIFLGARGAIVLSKSKQERLLYFLYDSINYNVKMLFGNARSFGQLIPLSDNILWVDRVGYPSYVIIFKELYQEIINYNNDKFTGFWDTLNVLTSQKLLLYPFIYEVNFQKEEEFRKIHRKVNEIKAKLINLIKSIRGS